MIDPRKTLAVLIASALIVAAPGAGGRLAFAQTVSGSGRSGQVVPTSVGLGGSVVNPGSQFSADANAGGPSLTGSLSQISRTPAPSLVIPTITPAVAAPELSAQPPSSPESFQAITAAAVESYLHNAAAVYPGGEPSRPPSGKVLAAGAALPAGAPMPASQAGAKREESAAEVVSGYHQGRVTFDGTDKNGAPGESVADPTTENSVRGQESRRVRPVLARSAPGAESAANGASALPAPQSRFTRSEGKGALPRAIKAVVGVWSRIWSATLRKPLRALMAGTIAFALLMPGCGPDHGPGGNGGSYPDGPVLPPVDLSQAIAVSPGRVSGNIGRGLNTRVFRLTAPNSGLLHAHVNMVPGAEWRLRLLDGDGFELDASYWTYPSDDPHVQDHVYLLEEYYVVLELLNDSGQVILYDVQLALPPSNTPYALRDAPVITENSVTGTISDPAASIYYRVDAQNDGLLSVRLNGVPDVQFRLIARNVNGYAFQSADSWYPGYDASFDIAATQAETYFLEIQVLNGAGAGQSFQLDVTQPW